jgi:hypothetical protein
MNKYLVEFQAVVGRQKLQVSDNDAGASMHPPVYLKYFGVVEAPSRQDVDGAIVLYRDPGFVTSVTKITEIDKTFKLPELLSMLDANKLITEMPA